mmetsp:Transcript_87/g.199  ORF Transcript_87/g.199 Transcript_87/m.199 type:complete len:150 (+) Transcript_87:420-869(+)
MRFRLRRETPTNDENYFHLFLKLTKSSSKEGCNELLLEAFSACRSVSWSTDVCSARPKEQEQQNSVNDFFHEYPVHHHSRGIQIHDVDRSWCGAMVVWFLGNDLYELNDLINHAQQLQRREQGSEQPVRTVEHSAMQKTLIEPLNLQGE